MAEVEQNVVERKDFLESRKIETTKDENQIVGMDLGIETSTQVEIGVQNADSEVSIQEPSTARLVIILLGLWLGVLLSALDQTMLATITGSISASFHSFSNLSWMTTTISIGISVSQPLSGQLTDIFGRRAGMVLCLSLFAIGTLMCGLAPKLWVFLFGRVVQGLGGGAIVTITSFIETDLVPMKKRALIEGIGNIVYGAVLALGGIYGGAVQNSIGWRWAFLIQVPIIVLDLLMVAFVLRIPQTKSPKNISSLRRIDWVGIACLLIFLLLLEFSMNTGGTTFSWRSAAVITSLVLAVVALASFAFWELFKATYPLFPLRALVQRGVASSVLSTFFATMGNTNIIYYTPIYLQVIGYSTSESGLRFISLAACFALGSFVAGYFVKLTARYYYVNLPVQGLMILGPVLLCTMKQSTPSWALFVYLGMYGAGSGGGYVTRLMGMLSSVDPKRRVVVQAATSTISNTGTILGLTIGSTIFQHLSVNKLQILFASQPELLHQIKNNFEALKDIDSSKKQSAINIYLKATRGVFLLALVAITFAAIASFCMENHLLTDKAHNHEEVKTEPDEQKKVECRSK